MTTALIASIVLSPFVLVALLARAAHHSGALRLHPEQFRISAPMSGPLFEDRDSYRAQRDEDAIRARFEQQPAWPSSGVTGERR